MGLFFRGEDNLEHKCELISVIIPIYNGEQYLQNMVSMIKAQTYRNIEVIVVDDGSRDNTVNKIKDLTQGDFRFQIYSKPNGGVSSARNYGMQKATGNYVTYVDADDYIFPEYLEKLYYLITKYDADWSQCSFIKVKEKEQKNRYDKMRIDLSDGDKEKVILFNPENALKDFAYRRNLNGYPFLKLIRIDIAKQIFFREDLKYAEDYTYVYELLKKTSKVVYWNTVEYLYIQHESSATHTNRNGILEYRKGWEQLNRIYQEVYTALPEAAGGIREKCYMQAIKDTSRINDKKDGTDYLKLLYKFIKENGKLVLNDRENKCFRRLLGLAGYISPEITCALCGLMLKKGYSLRRLA